MEYRVEQKYLVSDLELAVLGKRLAPIMRIDEHQIGTSYQIRSVYFDDCQDSCMDENDAGIDDRQKYRIRTYGGTNSLIRCEIKGKKNGLTRKTSCILSPGECSQLLGCKKSIPFGDRKVLNSFSLQMRCRDLRPKVLIAYERTAYVYPAGNVRITFDRNIMASKDYDSFLSDTQSFYIPILPKGMHILEVKYDEFLPYHIAQQIETGKLQQTSFSKYYLGRLALDGDFHF